MNDDKLAEIRERHERADADARITWIRIGMDAHDDRAALLAEVERLTADAAALREALKLQHQEDKAICTPAFNAVRAALEGKR